MLRIKLIFLINQNHKPMRKEKLLLGAVIVLMTACTAVKPYQKMHLNDPCMDLVNNKLDYFEVNFQTYREGASGANGGKVGGGCGCN